MGCALTLGGVLQLELAEPVEADFLAGRDGRGDVRKDRIDDFLASAFARPWVLEICSARSDVVVMNTSRW
jgi:hypothetical protein